MEHPSFPETGDEKVQNTEGIGQTIIKQTRFSIRDLLFLTTIVALSVGWWIDRSSLATQVHELRKRMEIRKFIENQHFGPRKPSSPSP